MLTERDRLTNRTLCDISLPNHDARRRDVRRRQADAAVGVLVVHGRRPEHRVERVVVEAPVAPVRIAPALLQLALHVPAAAAAEPAFRPLVSTSTPMTKPSVSSVKGDEFGGAGHVPRCLNGAGALDVAEPAHERPALARARCRDQRLDVRLAQAAEGDTASTGQSAASVASRGLPGGRQARSQQVYARGAAFGLRGAAAGPFLPDFRQQARAATRHPANCRDFRTRRLWLGPCYHPSRRDSARARPRAGLRPLAWRRHARGTGNHG